MNDEERALFEDAQKLYPNDLRARAHAEGDAWVAELIKVDGTVVWPVYAHGRSELLAVLAAEQRFLVEDAGDGALPGRSYADKAEERLRRWLIK